MFTSYERSIAKSSWSTKSANLTRESFLPFGSCILCLGIAREPVACQQGDIFCRECALANILSQKKELKRAEKSRHDAEAKSARLRQAEDLEDQSRALLDFESTLSGGTRSEQHPGSKTEDVENGNIEAVDITRASTKEQKLSSGSKRKILLDQDELDRIERGDKAKARKLIQAEHVRVHLITRLFVIGVYVNHSITPGSATTPTIILDTFSDASG